jgi:hypothetical protein
MENRRWHIVDDNVVASVSPGAVLVEEPANAWYAPANNSLPRDMTGNTRLWQCSCWNGMMAQIFNGIDHSWGRVTGVSMSRTTESLRPTDGSKGHFTNL